jgi:hypothetical protein
MPERISGRVNNEMKNQQTIMLFIVMSAGLIATTTTMTNVYGQAEHCVESESSDGTTTSERCVTQGKDPSINDEICHDITGCQEFEEEVTHREGANRLSLQQRGCAADAGECSVNPNNDDEDDD